MDSDLTHEQLIAAKQAKGLIMGRPIEITHDETFTVSLPLPPLHRPTLEVLVEGMVVRDKAGAEVERLYRAYPAGLRVRVGGVEIDLAPLSAVDATKDGATQKLCALAGQAVGQVYVKLLTSEDPNEVEAARSMEIVPDLLNDLGLGGGS